MREQSGELSNACVSPELLLEDIRYSAEALQRAVQYLYYPPFPSFDYFVAKEFIRYWNKTSQPAEVALATQAFRLWAPGVEGESRLGPELRTSLWSSILRSNAVDDGTVLHTIVDTLNSLYLQRSALPNRNGVLETFIDGMEVKANGILMNSHTSKPELYKKVGFYAALTDRGIVKESLWGKIGIGRFDTNTPFEITEEVYRRLVIEKRDVYAFYDMRTHHELIAKYCQMLMRRVVADPERRNREVIQRNLQFIITGKRPLLKPIVEFANRITTAANQVDGIPDQDGRYQKPSELLSAGEGEGRSLGEAVRRILWASRYQQGEALLSSEQEYRDSVHVAIIHELSTMDGQVARDANRVPR